MNYINGYQGIGFILNEEEMQGFCKNYKAEKDVVTELEMCTTIDESFSNSFSFYPRKTENGELNMEYEEISFNNLAYLFPIDFNNDDVSMFMDKTYKPNIIELKKEYGEYLPANFDWDCHIGLYYCN